MLEYSDTQSIGLISIFGLDDGIYSDSIEINEIIQRNFLSWNNWVRSRIFVSNEYNDEFVPNEWIILRKCWNSSNMSYRTHKKP